MGRNPHPFAAQAMLNAVLALLLFLPGGLLAKAPEDYSIMERSVGFFGNTFGAKAIFVSNQKARIEEHENGRLKIFTIIDPDREAVYIMDPQQQAYDRKTFSEWKRESFEEYPGMAWSFATFAVWKYGGPPLRASLQPAGTETVRGESCDKFKILALKKNEALSEYLWVSKANSLPVRLTKSSQGRTAATEWTGLKKAALPATTFEIPAGFVEKPDTSNMAFAFSNRTGDKFLATRITHPEKLTKALCPGNIRLDIKYAGHQKRDPVNDTGRSTMYNFDHVEGELFHVARGQAAGPCLLVSTAFLASREMMPFERKDSKSGHACDEKDRNRISEKRNRRVARCHAVGRWARHTLIAVEYDKSQGELASLVSLGDDRVIFRDFPGNGGWRAGDDGAFQPDFDVLFLLQNKAGEVEIGLAWMGEEGAALSLLQSTADRFIEIKNDYFYHMAH